MNKNKTTGTDKATTSTWLQPWLLKTLRKPMARVTKAPAVQAELSLK